MSTPKTHSTPVPAKAEPIVVACLGSSSTAGKGQAFNWITELERRPHNQRFRFHNYGVGGDLAYNALQRLPDVLKSHPQKVFVWVGGNDVLAMVSPRVRRFYALSKHLPTEPTLEWFRENLQTIARRLNAETAADIALCSLGPIGEDPSSKDPFQNELNHRIEQCSAIIREIARAENTAYIAIYEALLAQIQASPGRALTNFSFLPFYRDAFRVLTQHKSPDEIAQMNGWHFHSDGVHLNSHSGIIVANLVQEFIDR